MADDDEELPPCIGERMRDSFDPFHRAVIASERTDMARPNKHRINKILAMEFAFWMQRNPTLPSVQEVSEYLNISLISAREWRIAFINARKPKFTMERQ